MKNKNFFVCDLNLNLFQSDKYLLHSTPPVFSSSSSLPSVWCSSSFSIWESHITDFIPHPSDQPALISDSWSRISFHHSSMGVIKFSLFILHQITKNISRCFTVKWQYIIIQRENSTVLKSVINLKFIQWLLLSPLGSDEYSRLCSVWNLRQDRKFAGVRQTFWKDERTTVSAVNTTSTTTRQQSLWQALNQGDG